MSLSSFIWSVADLLRGDYKQSEYGKVILPFTILRRLDCVLAPTKAAVLAAQTSPSYPSTSQTNLVGRLTGVNVDSAPYAWIVYSYDALGRVNVKSECLPIDCGNNHHDMRRTYNLAGELTFYDRGLDADRNSAYPNQGFYFGGYNLSYDGAGNLSQVTGDTAGTNTATNIFSNTDYFPTGQLYTAQVLGTYNDKFSVNTRGWYTGEILTNSGGTTVWQSTTTPNNVGNVTASTDTANGHWTYTYDQLNRLGTAAGPQGTTSYTLDDFGNMSGKTVTAGSGWPLAGLQPTPYNSLSGNGLQYDLGTFGRITYDGYHHYTYDAEGRLEQVDTTCYVYDGEGNRVAKTNCSTGIQVEYLYDSDGRLISEVNVSTEQISRANIYAGNRFIAEDSPDSYYPSTTTATQMRVLDQVGSLRGLLDLGQHVVSSYTGGPWGDSYTCSSGEDMLFTGQKCDSESQLNDLGARYYGSSMGRFMSPDPSGLYFANPFNPQSLNLYSYGLNNPLVNIDPNGLDCIHINNDTGAYEGFESGDCDNSTTEKANSGQYIDGTVSTIYTTTGDANGVVTGYTGSRTNDDGSSTLLSGTFATPLGQQLAPIPQIDPDQQRITALVQGVAKDTAGFPDVCSGGAFVYAGVQGKVGSGHGFAGYLGNYDSKEGWSNSGLVEGSKGNASGGAAAGSKGAEGLVFIPFAEAGGGLVGVSRNGLSVGGYAGTPENLPVGAGAGAYFNITTMGACAHH
jgi:RHS repeat-associated protein